MAQTQNLASAQLALEPIFRRVVQVTPRNTSDNHSTSKADGELLGKPQHRQLQTSRDDVEACDIKASTDDRSRLIIAVDFGTTYSTVSYTKIGVSVDPTEIPLSKIHCVSNYQHAAGNSESRTNTRADNVPTKLLYLGPSAPDSELSENESDLESDSLNDKDVGPTPRATRSIPRRRKRGRNSNYSSPRRKPNNAWSRPTGVTIKWGFDVQYVQRIPQEMARYPEKEVVELVKLTLGDESDIDDDLRRKREQLEQQIDRLRGKGIIHDRDHVLRDYLVRLLRHAKITLKDDGVLDGAHLEYVLCIPVSWSESACRTMHDAMVKAIQVCGLGVLAQNLIPDLFIVSEPEAAAQFVMASLGNEGRLRKGEVFVLLDAGGGTVDSTTYKVTSDEMGPLRLKCEAVKPEGALCGSSLITERYMRKLREKLADIDPYGDPQLLDGIATAFANDWDMLDKPTIDIAHKKTMPLKFARQSHNNQRIKWTEAEFRAIFEPSLTGTTNLLERQLDLAKQKGLLVSKLIVVGGFGESPSLKRRIREVLSARADDSGEDTKIEAIWPRDFPTSAVARGAVLRALDKRNGPRRKSRSSFGFLRHEEHGSFPEHAEANAIAQRDGVDHVRLVKDTIYWLIDAGEEIASSYKTEPILSCHTFEKSDRTLICSEKLYVSKKAHRSHFQRQHPENNGASLLSHIEIDVSDLRDKFPLEEKADAGPRTKESNRYSRLVRFDLVIEVSGKQLKYEATWPPGAARPEDVLIRKSNYISLAPSFMPGTE